jgi:hypothetical protein
MNASTRSSQKRHRAKHFLAAGLVVVLWGDITKASPSQPDQDVQTSSLPAFASTTYNIAMATVKSGEEGLELSAVFAENIPQLVKDVDWQVTDAQGILQFNDITKLAEAKLAPGDYKISANYGMVHIEESVSLPAGTKLDISFVLNAGALRILPRIKTLGWSTVPSEIKIFALSGLERGKLIASTYSPGEILKLPVGTYRIESRFAAGNAKAVTDVHVDAGVMSAVNIDHIAGVAHVTADSDVKWTVKDDAGLPLQTISTREKDMVLKPGVYKAEANVNGQLFSKTFTIESGQSLNVSLEN